MQFILGYFFWNVNHLDVKLGQLIGKVMSNISRKTSHGLEDLFVNLDSF